MIERLILTGMSGAGKSTVGALVASRLAWQFIDMDDAIEAETGRSIPAIFAEDGEPAFRQLESSLLDRLLDQKHVVVSTGGGAVCNDVARLNLSKSASSLTVWLSAPAETLLARVQAHSDESRTTMRPMLVADDQLTRMESLIEQRREYYGAADIAIPVANRTVDRTADDLVELVQLANGTVSEVVLRTGQSESRIRVGRGIAESLIDVIATEWPKAQAIWIGVDTNVAQANKGYLDRLSADSLIPFHSFEIPSGESSKSLESYGRAIDWMLSGGIERGDVVVALGGGVVGDLMGFVAATVLRGVGLVQIPTTLLSMVDSSVGGKTGINHTTGKNLIGSFYQPPIVLIDPNFLQTLPDRELRSGFGEIIKHGVIQGSTPNGESGFLQEVLRLNAKGLLALKQPLTSWVIRQNVSLKSSVVEADEREADLRQLLNFGHTIGHGIEAADYALLHGEAVSVGMIAAMTIAAARGDIDAVMRNDLAILIESFGLPTSASANGELVRIKMGSDKKKSAGKQNWVLPQREGGVAITNDVSEQDIASALEFVLGHNS